MGKALHMCFELVPIVCEKLEPTDIFNYKAYTTSPGMVI